MEEVFRFLLSRPAQAADRDDVATPLRGTPEFEAALKRDNSVAAVRPLAAKRSHDLQIRSLSDLAHGQQLLGFYRDLSHKPDRPPPQLSKLVEQYFNAKPAALVASTTFQADRARLSDLVVAHTILGTEAPVPLAQAADLLRGMAVIERIASGGDELGNKGVVAGLLKRSLLLPGGVFPLARAPAAGEGGGTEPVDRLTPLRERRDNVLSAYQALTRIEPANVFTMDSAAPRGVPELEEGPETRLAPSGEAVEPPAVEPSGGAVDRPDLSTFGDADVAGVSGAPLVLTQVAAESLGSSEKQVLGERGLDVTSMSVPAVVDRLSLELQDLELKVVELEAPLAERAVRLGSTLVLSDVAFGVAKRFPPAPGPQSVPSTRGSVAPAGIGDLLVVRQFLKQYEGRELAHVENVLRGEFKERFHKRGRTTEETFTTEVETTKEEERDLQTTERFELQTESSTVIKEDTSLKAGFSVSGKYGPAVEFKASTDFALSNSKEEATKVATEFSKDVTSRARSKIAERRREQRILRTIEIFEETNTHGFDNKAGDAHVVGQYQWIDKIFEAQVFNYGKRLLFDIMVPEPAAFLIHAVAGKDQVGADLVKPVPFTLKATDITEWNYAFYTKQYEAIGIEPPPQPYVTVSKALEGQGNNSDEGVATKALEAPIKDGYQAVAASVVTTFTLWTDNVGIDVVVGKRGHRFTKSNGWSWSVSMDNEVDTVPVTVKTFRANVFTVAVEIHCQRTQRALDAWKLKTHAAILQAYQQQVREYEEKLAELQIQAGVQIEGRHPAENERLVRDELKKNGIATITAQHYDLFGAITTSTQGYPQPNLPEADLEGRYIRFFEQAFEWEQMVFFFYPYFWGRKAHWRDRALLEDVDPLFSAFLRAGAARIVIAVRPGFEQAVAHFMDTGEIWNGGDLPPITSPLYLNIIEEIRERDEAQGDEIAQGDPWDVRLPTTLVKLRDSTALPSWEKNAEGDWVPA